MNRWWLPLLAVLHCRPALPYNLGSGVTDPCHERLSLPSIEELTTELDDRRTVVPLPKGDLWQKAADQVFSALPREADPGRGSAEERFVALSLLLGVRSPDTEGHSVSSPVALRRVHSNPTAEAQHVHCLRAATDDGEQADLAVILAANELIERALTESGELLLGPPEDLLRKVPFYFELSGQVSLEVFAPAYLLGRALHVLQDSYSHTIRTEDGREVLSVLNFVEAADGSLDSERDGLAHSRAMDQCEDEQLAPLVERARAVSLSATEALLDLEEGDETALTRGLSPCPVGETDEDCGWIAYAEQCESALTERGNLSGTCCDEPDLCSTPWLATAEQAPTAPLPEDLLGCSLSGANALSRKFQVQSLSTPGVLLAACLALLLRRRRRRIQGVQLCSLLWFTELLTTPADARGPDAKEPLTPSRALFGALEVHGSLLAGTPERSLPDVTFGPGLRFGWLPRTPKPLAVGYFGVIEQSSYVLTEFEPRVTAGVLNLGAGVDISYFDVLRGSLALGPSILLADAPARDAPTLGLFVDLRPVGLRFRLGKSLRITLDPLTATWVAPGLVAPMVTSLRYRLVVGVEWLHDPTKQGRAQTGNL